MKGALTAYNILFSHRIFQVIAVKTKIMITDRPEQITVGKDLENKMKKAIFLALKERGILTQEQCEESIKRI